MYVCVCMQMCAHVNTYYGIHVKMIEQLVGVSSLLLCKFPELNFSPHAWQQTPVLAWNFSPAEYETLACCLRYWVLAPAHELNILRIRKRGYFGAKCLPASCLFARPFTC